MYNYSTLNTQLLYQVDGLLHDWLPQGRRIGKEYVCGSLSGAPGDSLKINCLNGKWADFATGQKGGDLISLYAAIIGLSNPQAFVKLAATLGIETDIARKSLPEKQKISDLIPIPVGLERPTFEHYRFGMPTAFWPYVNSENQLLFYVVRYDPPGEKKQFLPWAYSSTKNQWIQKGWPEPRPLFGLQELLKDTSKPLLIVEGEKACLSARELVGDRYSVVTWPNGSNAYHKADWSLVTDRKILLWPDHDEAGWRAAEGIAKILAPHNSEIKIIQTRKEQLAPGFDAADFVQKYGTNWKQFLEWAKPLATVYSEKTPESPSVNLTQINVNMEQLVERAELSQMQLWDKCDLVLSGRGEAMRPVPHFDNACRVLRSLPEFKDAFWFDEFHQRVFTTWPNGQKHMWDEGDDLALWEYFQKVIGLTQISFDSARRAAQRIYSENVKYEPRDWMNTLQWDGVSRVHAFFSDYMGAEATEYTMKVALNFWISIVARTYRPGCKVDNMVILEGKQGNYKSEALAVIGGDWYAVSNGALHDKDFLQTLQGKLIVEVAELDSFSKAEVNTIKKMISTRIDTYRASYGRYVKNVKRQCVLVGTTNDSHYLKDPTGGRRFWPIATEGRLRIDQIRKDRDQLFAEAIALYKQNYTWWEMPEEATEQMQEARRVVDIWEEIFEDYVNRLNLQEVTIKEILVDAIRMEISKIDQSATRRASNVLKVLGWHQGPRRRENGRMTRPWVKN